MYLYSKSVIHNTLFIGLRIFTSYTKLIFYFVLKRIPTVGVWAQDVMFTGNVWVKITSFLFDSERTEECIDLTVMCFFSV